MERPAARGLADLLATTEAVGEHDLIRVGLADGW
jgi:hypothetical protein